jgi:hypothetical protein
MWRDEEGRKKKDEMGGEEGVFIPQGSGVALAWVSFRSPPTHFQTIGVALAWGVLQVTPHFSTSPLQLPAL